ncbi:transcription factor btf3, putative [Eimeria praecox]|uniref:Transcription factor btf3, putative n=1 Tax=Eimeria praecox TaxID=51316 RepID=U6H0E7_9EIME|nr:transcription factor btf3, putative [Eimeria praecox]
MSALGEFCFEGIYSFIADERSKVVVIGGPCREVDEAFRINTDESSIEEQQKAFLSESQKIPITAPLHLTRTTQETISNELAFRNHLYPLEAAITAFLVCNSRWESFRQALQNCEQPCRTRPAASSASICPSGTGVPENIPIGTEESLQRLVSFSVITARRCLREFSRFLFPRNTQYNTPFATDVDLVGQTLILTPKGPAKTIPVGCGRDFEQKVTSAAAVHSEEGKIEELTNSYVLYSFNLCQNMQVLVTAEIDAIDPGFNLLPKTAASRSRKVNCCGEPCTYEKKTIGSNALLVTAEIDAIDPGFNLLPKTAASSSRKVNCCGEPCTYEKKTIGSNACYIHSCAGLSVLEQQLVLGCPPLVELKSHSICNAFQWEEAADQMLLGGVRLLMKAAHTRGSVETLELLPYECVRKLAGSWRQPNSKWHSVLSLMQHLYKHAERARSREGADVGCIEVAYDGKSDYLTIRSRRMQNARISSDAAKWLKQSSKEHKHSDIETGT